MNTISPVLNLSAIHAIISATRHMEVDNAESTKRLAMSKLAGNELTVRSEIEQAKVLSAIANRLIIDNQNTDPFWINNVNYVASYNRHNYVHV